MRHQTIHTKYHKLPAATTLPVYIGRNERGHLQYLPVPDDWVETGKMEEMIAVGAGLPRYVLYGDFIEHVRRNGKSIVQLMEADIPHLPYPAIMVEYETVELVRDNEDDRPYEYRVRNFVLLSRSEEHTSELQSLRH